MSAGARATVDAALATPPGEAGEELSGAATLLLCDPWWLPMLLAPWLDRLADDPWYQPPLRAARDPLRTSAVLAESAGALLTATVIDAAALAVRRPATTLAASGRVAIVRYHRAGRAMLRRWDAGAVDADVSAASPPSPRPLPAISLADGEVRRLDGRRYAFAIEAAGGSVVTLTVAPRRGGLTREYDRASGRLLRVAGNDDDVSRTRMLLTLLRVSGRADAAARFDAATRAPSFHLRWAAMREWLALDAASALPRLLALTDDPHDEVRAAARATLPMVEARLCRA